MDHLQICLVTPSKGASVSGNSVTADRWASILTELGHQVRVEAIYADQSCDLLVALHARKSYPSIKKFAQEHPARPLIVALTGTDVYGDIASDASAKASLDMAWRLIVLQSMAADELPAAARNKVRVIHQSCAPILPARSVPTDAFEIIVLGNLRPVKDPLRAAYAARMLPASSRIHITHIGAAADSELGNQAKEESDQNPRYTWVGSLPREEALQLLGQSKGMVLSSRSEGGANVISEAVAAGVPVLASRIPGSVGLLGEEYPGYFEVGDSKQLADLLTRVESDQAFYGRLQAHISGLAPLFHPDAECDAWRSLLDEVIPRSASS